MRGHLLLLSVVSVIKIFVTPYIYLIILILCIIQYVIEGRRDNEMLVFCSEELTL